MSDIAQGRLSDLPHLMSIENVSQFHPWKASIMERYLKQGSVLVLHKQGAVVGLAVVTVVVGDAELLNIAVAPEHRGQGCARRLLSAVEERVVSKQGERIFLEVRASNAAAIALYESNGYCQAGTRSNYYPAPGGGREDAWLYCCELGL